MPAPLIIWGIIAGASALTGLGYASYKAREEQEQQEQQERQAREAREAARQAQAEREQAQRQAQYQQQLGALQTQVTAQVKALGLKVSHKLTPNELMAWAALADDHRTTARQQPALFTLLDVPPAQKAVLADLLSAMDGGTHARKNHPLLKQLDELQQLRDDAQALIDLEADLVKVVST